MSKLNELYRTEEQVKAMNPVELKECLSLIDIHFSQLMASVNYQKQMDKVRTVGTLENKEFAALNVARSRIVHRLLYWFCAEPVLCQPSGLTHDQLTDLLNSFSFPAPVVQFGEWQHEPRKLTIDVQLDTGKVLLIVEHKQNRIDKTYCCDAA